MSTNGKREKVVRTAVSLLPIHIAMIDARAKDQGLISRSAALRVMLDRLAELEAREAGVLKE